MSLKKFDVVVDCNQCVCTSSDSVGGFDINVPVCDAKTGFTMNAALHCVISSDRHEVGIVGWDDSSAEAAPLSEDLSTRLNSILEYIEDHRICGNERICPSEVVRIARKQNSR